MGSKADVGVGGNPIQEGWPCPGLSEHRNIIRGVSVTVTALSGYCSLLQESIYRLLPDHPERRQELQPVQH